MLTEIRHTHTQAKQKVGHEKIWLVEDETGDRPIAAAPAQLEIDFFQVIRLLFQFIKNEKCNY